MKAEKCCPTCGHIKSDRIHPGTIGAFKRVISQPRLFDVIIRIVCDHFQKTEEDIRVKSKGGDLALCRQLIWYFAREYTTISYTVMANRFGKDHATALHGFEHIRDLYSVRDKRIVSLIEVINTQLSEQLTSV